MTAVWTKQAGSGRRRRGSARCAPSSTMAGPAAPAHTVQDSLATSSGVLTARQYSTRHGPPRRHTLAMRQSNSLRQQVTTRRALSGKRAHGGGSVVHGGESDVTTVLRHCLGRRLGRRKSLRLNRRVGGRIMPGGRPSAFKSFICPNCQALYQIVKVEAGPETIDREPTCRACGGPLAGRDGKFVLKYFLLRKAARTWRRP